MSCDVGSVRYEMRSASCEELSEQWYNIIFNRLFISRKYMLLTLEKLLIEIGIAKKPIVEIK